MERVNYKNLILAAEFWGEIAIKLEIALDELF